MGMITEKTLALPSYTSRTVRRKLSLFADSDNAISALALHFRREGDCLVCAEGAERVQPLAPGAKLYRSDGHGRSLFVYAGGTLKNLGSGLSYSLSAEPTAVLCFLDGESGTLSYFAVTENGVYALAAAGAQTVTSEGGACAAVHYERIFTVSGCRVRYSKPLAPGNWTQAVQDAGYLDLPSADGEPIALISYKEKLYLFRRCGITQLRALGDTLNFKAVSVPYACGNIMQGSVCNCGERILFLTESGLYSFGGSTCERIDGAGTSLIDFGKPLKSTVYDGKYYCAVQLLGGEKCIFCADPERKTGHYIRFAAESVAGDDALYFSENGYLYRLTPRGVPSQADCIVRTEPSFLGLSDGNKFLDCIAVEGEGRFVIEARSERGAVSSVCGKAGERARFPRPVRGNAFSLTLRSLSENAKIRAVLCGLREENRTW